MRTRIINNNLVVLFENSIDTVLSLDTLKTISVATFSDKNPNPIITQFPEVTAVTIPEVQISALLQRSTLIVGDQSIGEYGSRNVLGLITLTNKIHESLGKPIKAYGYNFICNISNSDFNALANKLKTKFFKNTFVLPTGSELKFVLPNLVFNKESAKISLKFNEVANDSGGESDFIRLNINVHYVANELLGIDDLKEDYDSMYNYIKDYLERVFE